MRNGAGGVLRILWGALDHAGKLGGNCFSPYPFWAFCGMLSVCLKGWWQGGDTEKNRPFPERDQCAAPAGGRDVGADKGLLPGGVDMNIQRTGGEFPNGK